jgi:hypothetical protein
VAHDTAFKPPPKLTAVYRDAVRSLVQVYYPPGREQDFNALLGPDSLLTEEHLLEFRMFALDVYGAMRASADDLSLSEFSVKEQHLY